MNFDISTIYIIGTILFLSVFLSRKGRFLNILRNNTDIYGVKHSWSKTILGLIIFILSVPLILFFGFYAAENNTVDQFALVALIFFTIVMVLQVKNMIRDRKTKKRL